MTMRTTGAERKVLRAHYEEAQILLLCGFYRKVYVADGVATDGAGRHTVSI